MAEMNDGLVPPPVLVAAVRALLDDVQVRRASLPTDTVDRAFYLGIEAAADEHLRPELAATHDERWLARQPLPFRDGYQRTRVVLAAVGPRD